MMKYGGRFQEKNTIKHSIEYRKSAKRNIKQIAKYIRDILKNPIAAQNFSRNIEKHIYNLSDFPYAGAIYKETLNRFIIYKNFLIIYEIKKEERKVIIKRIIHKSINI